MPAPTITAAPDPPLRTEDSATFTSKAEAFVEWMAGAPDEFNALALYLQALESGTLSDKLAAIDALTWAANKVIYLTGTNTVATSDLTSVARTLLAQTTQALMRTTGLGMSANGSSLVAAADYAAMGTLLLSAATPLTFNFTAAGDAYFYADEAMTLTQQATVGTGTIAYAKGTTAAPTTFSSTSSPISLQAGAWLKVTASSVTGAVAVHLKRTA